MNTSITTVTANKSLITNNKSLITTNQKDKLEKLIFLNLTPQLNIELKEIRLEQAYKKFPELSTYEIYIYKQIFPECKKKLKNYSNELIPDLIIEDLFLSTKLNLFEKIQLWQPKQKIKDPMLVGIINPHIFNLGVWGNPKININDVEKQILQDFYPIKNRIKQIIDKTTIQSAKNTFEIFVTSICSHKSHCRTPNENLTNFITFDEYDADIGSSPSFLEFRVQRQTYALCPICNKIIVTSPTAVE